MITSASSLEPDQARQNVGPDLDPKLLDTLLAFPKESFEELILNTLADNKKTCKITQ